MNENNPTVAHEAIPLEEIFAINPEAEGEFIQTEEDVGSEDQTELPA